MILKELLENKEDLLILAGTLKAMKQLSMIVPTLKAFQRRHPGDDEIAGLLCEAEGALPLVSVQMVVWNGEKYIAEAVESVLNQTYPNVELVVVDDGSTDRTREIVEGFRSDRIRYVCKEHGGVAPARNEALRHCRGDCIAILDSDDLYEPDMLQAGVDALRENPELDAVYTDLAIIDDRGKETGVVCSYENVRPDRIIAETFLEGCNAVPFGSMMVRRELVDRIGPFDERFSISEDSDYIVRLARLGQFGHINRTLYRCRRHESNLSHDLKSRKNRAEGTFLLLCKMLALFPREELCPDIPWEKLSGGRAEAEFHFQVGRVFWKHCQGHFHSGGYERLLERALQHTEKGLECDPDHRDGKNLMEKIRFLSMLGNGDRTGKNAPDDASGENICRRMIEAGWYFVEKRRLDEGRASFSMILEMKWLPARFGMEALLGLGKIEWLKGDAETAKKHYTKALQLLNTFERNACLSNLSFLSEGRQTEER